MTEYQKAIEIIENILTSDLFLLRFDPKLEIIMASDASNYGIGTVLLHKHKDGSVKVIAHASRTFLSIDKNYNQIEKEALAIIFAAKILHKFIHERKEKRKEGSTYRRTTIYCYLFSDRKRVARHGQ